MPRWEMSDTVIRVTAVGDGQTWVYQYPPALWQKAVRRIMSDLRKEKIPELAAIGLVQVIASGAASAAE